MAAPAVAIFDLDGTITDGDTYLGFLLAVLRARPHRLARCIGLGPPVLGFALSRVSNDALKRGFLGAVAGGCTRAMLDPIAARFVRRSCARMVKPAARARIGWHRAQGHRLILATAGLDLYAEGIGRALGFADVVCTRAGWEGGRITGALAGANLLGEHKLAAIRALGIGPAGERPQVYAYSDHHSDLPLLRFADSSVAVDPTPRLARLAQSHGFAIERWRG